MHPLHRNIPFLLAILFIGSLAGTSDAQVCLECHDVHHQMRETGVHLGGVAACDYCHTMHNSQDNAPIDPDHPEGNAHLLRRATATEVCLLCHADYVSHNFGSDPLNPGGVVGAGDFVFLLEDNLNDGHGGAGNPIPGRAAGHNVVVPSMNVGPDDVLTVAPGGEYPSDRLGCTSCHDPHGNGNFRNLYDVGQVAQAGFFAYTNPAPDAEGKSIYHGYESNSRHTAYQGGMSEWCANCHSEYHASLADFKHPSGLLLGPDIAEAYASYDGSDDPLGGAFSTAYLAQVPFEDPSNTTTSTQGPTEASRIMCLTCHRAHASSAPDAGRWDFALTFLEDDGVASGSYPIPNPYGSLNQRSLCNKCHVKDLDDAPRPE